MLNANRNINYVEYKITLEDDVELVKRVRHIAKRENTKSISRIAIILLIEDKVVFDIMTKDSNFTFTNDHGSFLLLKNKLNSSVYERLRSYLILQSERRKSSNLLYALDDDSITNVRECDLMSKRKKQLKLVKKEQISIPKYIEDKIVNDYYQSGMYRNTFIIDSINIGNNVNEHDIQLDLDKLLSKISSNKAFETIKNTKGFKVYTSYDKFIDDFDDTRYIKKILSPNNKTIHYVLCCNYGLGEDEARIINNMIYKRYGGQK